MPTLFISYKRGDSAVEPVVQALREAKYRTWFDKENILTGTAWRNSIDHGIEQSAAIIAVLNQEATESPYVLEELNLARAKNKPIFPVITQGNAKKQLDKLGLEEIQYVDLTQTGYWKQTIQQLIDHLVKNGILQTGKNTAGIQVREEVMEKLGGGKQPLVRVTINKYTYRSAVAVMGGKYMISFNPEHRKAAGVQAGEEADVTLELDLEPRTVEIPQDLKDALMEAHALEAFENSAPSMKKEYVRRVQDAKAQETRERRINKIVEKLSAS